MGKKIITKKDALELMNIQEELLGKLTGKSNFGPEAVEAGQQIGEAMVSVLDQYGLKALAIPKELGYTNPNDGYSKTTIVDSGIHPSGRHDRNIRYDLYCSPEMHVLREGGSILVKMLEAIEYYKKHNIPESDWGGENDITRVLRGSEECLSAELIPSTQEHFLGVDCTVVTMFKAYPWAGLRLCTLVDFIDIAPEAIKPHFSLDCFEDRRYSFMMMVECGVKGIADLIGHYGIPVSDASTMLSQLAQAMKDDAATHGFRSAKDFCHLFKKLGIYFQLGQPEDMRNDEFFPQE